MNQKPSVHAYWRARKETHWECVARTLRFMEAISKEPGLHKWFIPGKSRKASEKPQELSMEAIGKRMKPIWKPIRGIPAPNSTDLLGFSFGVWNCDDAASAGISVDCGSYSPNKKNRVSLRLPKQPFPGDDASRERFKRLLDIFAEVWDPDFSIVATDERHRSAFAERDWINKRDVWEEGIIKSAWLLYKRDQSIVVNSDT
jgi:hypothetical protein